MTSGHSVRKVPDAWSAFALVLGLASLLLVLILALLGYGREALMLLILVAVIATAGLASLLAARRAVRKHGDVIATDADNEASPPTLLLDEEEPIGAASETELSRFDN